MYKVIENKNTLRSKTFGLYLALGGITMMFAALTSAYIVRKGAGNWLEFRLPASFFVSTVVILLSSVSVEMSYRGFVNGKESVYKTWLVITTLLGFLFCYMQYVGWNNLYAIGVELAGNPAGSFVYALSGLHVAHVLGGIAALSVALIHAFTLKYRVTEIRKNRFRLVIKYWHYVDILWLYLLLFFLIFR